MAYAVNLSGADLANHLADELSDLEFELLIRARIKASLAVVHKHRPNLSESHDSITFRFDGRDKSTWSVDLGETYSKNASTTGEVLSTTFYDTLRIMDAKDGNKLSLLLTGPSSFGAGTPMGTTAQAQTITNGLGPQPMSDDRISF